MEYKITVPLERVKEGMVIAKSVYVKNEQGQMAMLVKSNVKLTESIIDKLKWHKLKDIIIFSDPPDLSKINTKTQQVQTKQETNPVVSQKTPVKTNENELTVFPEKKTYNAYHDNLKDQKSRLAYDEGTRKTNDTNNYSLKTKKEIPAAAKMRSVSIVRSNFSDTRPVLSEDLYDEALGGIKNLFEVAGGSKMITAHQVVKELDNVVDQLVETVSAESGELVHIAHLKSYDEYTYHHSLSVAVLSIAIGQALNLFKPALRKLGSCAIMHDIGKILVPIDIINKPSRLTPEEFEIVKTHSSKGAEYLESQGIGDQELWNAVRHHHEKYDGSGYPSGLKGSEIPLFSRIVSVADVYDALTSYRSYRTPMAPPVAFETVMGEVDRAFEIGVVNAFIKKVELYPEGSIVVLSDGRMAVVVDNSYAMRPILKLVDTQTHINLGELDNLHLVIDRVLDFE